MSSHPAITGIGLAVPPVSAPQERVGELVIEALGLRGAAARRARTIYRRSRIERRHGCLARPDDPLGPLAEALRPDRGGALGTAARMRAYAEHAPRLAMDACRDLFSRVVDTLPGQVDHVIVTSCTGFLAPGLDVLLARALELRSDVARTLVGFQGCQAGLSALRLAEQACRADPRSRVLVVSVELSSIHLQAEPSEDNLLAGALFADGAAAVLVTGAEVPLRGRSALVERTFTALHPDSLGEMTWEVGDDGFTLRLSRLLPRLVGLDFGAILRQRLDLSGPDKRDGSFWAVHPGGTAILDAIERSLALPSDALDASREVLRGHGNMSSPTVFFVLRRILDDPCPERGVALAFGPGLTLEAACLRLADP